MGKKSKENDIESNEKSNNEKDLEDKSHEWKQRITTQLIIMTTTLGLLFLFVGICAQIFSADRLYVFIFGLICLLPITNGVLYYICWRKQNSIIVLAMSLINLSWIVAAIVLILLYKLWLTNNFFETDIVFQFSLLFFVLVAIALAVCYYLINQSLSQTNGKPKAAAVEPQLKKDSKPEEKKGSKPEEKKGSKPEEKRGSKSEEKKEPKEKNKNEKKNKKTAIGSKEEAKDKKHKKK